MSNYDIIAELQGIITQLVANHDEMQACRTKGFLSVERLASLSQEIGADLGETRQDVQYLLYNGDEVEQDLSTTIAYLKTKMSSWAEMG